jgi:hypothetical protein
MTQKKNPDPGPDKQNFIIPMAQDPAKAAAEAAAKAALEAALQAAGQALPPNNPTPGSTGRTLRINTNSSVRVIRRNQQSPFVWLKSPGTLIFGITSQWKLEDNAQARKTQLRNEKIEKIRCARFDGEKIIHLWVTDSLDPDGILVTETESGLQANIANWLFREGIAPDPGIKQKFDLLDSPELTLGLPALTFNMGKAKKTTYFDTTDKKDQGSQPPNR